jgi:hypothetical protein
VLKAQAQRYPREHRGTRLRASKSEAGPMITHVVLMKFLPTNKDANMARAKQLLLGMVGKVSSLRQLEVGLNCVPSERAFDLALVTRFDDLTGLSAYADDPVHVEVKRFLGTVVEKAHVVDYESV